MPSSNPLPPKEAALFKRILKCYEHKQYKNGLKFAKQILSNPKYAEHGETLAMKGLILNCLAKKDEAYDNVKRGLRNDLKSHVCWHVYGLLQRSDRKYDEAIKCYRNALKWDKENLQILRDLSLLQVQMRDLEGYKETRHQLLLLRPAQRVSWIGFAMALHLVNEFDMAITVLEEYRKTQQPRSFDYEHSEFLLYENQVMREAGLLEKALDHLHQNQDYILDVLVFQESKADILMRLGRWEEAKQVVESLIERNTENWEYLRLLQRCSAAESTESRLRLFDQLCQRFQRAQAPRRMALYLEYDTADLRQRFRDTLNAYLRAGLSRGPPLFASIKSLYSDAWKVAVIEELLVSYLDEVNAGRDPTCPSAESTESDDSLLPCTALWVNIILAQHWSAVGRSADAMRHVDAAIEHTPTMVELYVLKAKIYKRGGDPAKAAQWMEEAQSMDTADRFLNSKCTKYLLRCDRVEDACSMASKFTREGVGAMENLNEMQCLWFLSECARAFQRQRRFGDALKKCIEIDRHFSEMVEDQFDFHTYCTRKMTLRSYMHMLRFEDGIRGHRFFVDAAVMAMNIYLELHDHPVADQDGLHDDQQDNLSAAELKKLKSKQRKAARRAQQQEEQRRDTEQSRPEELDPATLERVERPLDEAARWLQPLQDRAASSVDTHLLAFELHWRRGKPLLMLQAAKRVHAIDPQHPRLHEHVVRLASRTFHVADAVATVLKQELHRLMGGHDVVDFDRRFLEDNRHSLPHLLEAMHVSVVHLKTTPPETAADALYAAKLMGQPLHAGIQMMDALHKGTFGVCTTQQMDTLRQQCRLAWPLATAFE